LDAKKLKRWCQTLGLYVRARAEKMLPSSSNTPSAPALEALTAMTLPALSPQNVEAKDSATESESNAEEGGYVSKNDLEITGEPSHTVEEAGKTNSHFGSMCKN
jgi:hypothetical protein